MGSFLANSRAWSLLADALERTEGSHRTALCSGGLLVTRGLDPREAERMCRQLFGRIKEAGKDLILSF